MSELNYLAFPGLKDLYQYAYLKNISLNIERTKSIRASTIISAVCVAFDVTEQRLTSKERSREITEPRHIAVKLLKDHTDLSLKSIGKLMGNRDHSTIIYASNTVSDLLETDKKFKRSYEAIKKTIFS